MKRPIPRDHLLAFARECLKLERLLSERDDLAELGKFLSLVRSLEKSGGISALEALLCPEHTGSIACDAEGPAAKTAAPPPKNATHPLPTAKRM